MIMLVWSLLDEDTGTVCTTAMQIGVVVHVEVDDGARGNTTRGYADTWYVYIATEDGRTLGIMTLEM